jgi:hypothetical protein
VTNLPITTIAKLDVSQVGTMILGFVGAIGQAYKVEHRALALDEVWILLAAVQNAYGPAPTDNPIQVTVVSPAVVFSFCGTCLLLSSPETVVAATTAILDKKKEVLALLLATETEEQKAINLAMFQRMTSKKPVGQA